MKICRDCSNVCEGGSVSCLRCGSSNLAVVEEKICNYCKSRIVVGTIICPHCHRVLPPETPVTVDNAAVMTDISQNQEVATAANAASMSVVNIADDENQTSATTYQENAKKEETVERAKDMEDFNKKNPLFAIYEKAPDILPQKEDKEQPEPTPAVPYQTEPAVIEQKPDEEITPSGYESGGDLETVAFQTGRISHEYVKPQNRLILYLLFAFGCAFTLVSLWTNYMVHSYGNVLGYEMACAVLVDYREVFPSVYPYILYGSGLLSKYQLLGSHLPFAMDFGILFTLVGGIVMMISAIPKWVAATLNFLAFACQVFGIWMMIYLFGFRTVGVSAYILAVGALAVFVIHMIVVKSHNKRNI